MQLRSLQYFLAVAEGQNFHKAAKALDLSQPALTMQIQALEEELGVRLFIRERQSVVLTYAGAVVQSEAQALIKTLHTAAELAKRAARGVTRLLRVGFVSSLATSHLLSSIVSTFGQEYPHVALDLKNISTSEQMALLEQGSLDVGFVRLPVLSAPFLKLTPVYSEPLVVLLPDQHYLAHQRHLTLQDMAQEPFVLYSRKGSPGYYDFVMHVFEEAGFMPEVSQEVGEIYTQVSLVAAGLGVALCPASTRQYNMAGVKFQYPENLPKVGIAIAVRKNEGSPECMGLMQVALAVGTVMEKH